MGERIYMSKAFYYARLIGGASMMSMALAASAQAADAPEQPAAAEIIVTGSRTIKNGDASPTPVTVISTQALTNARPTSLTESLNVLPVFSGSRGQVSNPSATGGVGGGNGSAAQLNLRNIGGQRNLVLMDGRRVPPASFTNIVDADVIPQLLISRVDVVTGGVSAVYGSDAVSGVVNFITDTKFTGFKAQAQAGISRYGDDANQDIGAAWGARFADGRGHVELSYEYRNSEGVSRRSDRAWYNRPVVIGNGTTVPYQLIYNAALTAQPFGGRITNCGTGCGVTGQTFAADGTISPFISGGAYTGVTNVQSGGSGGYYDNSLKAAQRTHQAYGRVDYELTDSISAFASLGANFKKNVFYGNDIALTNVKLVKTNAYLPASVASAITSADGTFTYNQIMNRDMRLRGEPETTQIIALAGLKGAFAGFDWDVAYTHGESRLKTVLYNNINQQRLSAALDAVAGPNGPVCYASTQAATAAAYANCVAINPFGPTAASQAALDYITQDTTYIAKTRQEDINASIAGSPFSTWAGAVKVALSAEWRKQSFSSSSDATPTQYADCTNLRYNCVAAGAGQTVLYQQTFAASPVVKQTVQEVALEATVPLVQDVPFIKALAVNGAARYTKYDTVGSYWTWKVGADWKVGEDLRLRGTISRDIRAPTLNDLYAPTSVVPVTNTDLLTNTAPTVPSINVSNSSLTAEIGNTKTIGGVLKPHFIPGLSLAVDYYNIEISNAIVTLQGFSDAVQNGCNLNGNAQYCSLIQRDATTNQVTGWYVKPYNLAKITTYGWDFEANYNGKLFNRPLALRGFAAYQPHIRYIQPGVPTVDQGGVAFGANGLTASPSWRLTGTASYSPMETFRVDVMYRWRNRMKLTGVPNVTWAAGQGTVAPFGQASLNLSWSPKSTGTAKSEFFLNVQNLFDAKPPVTNATGTATGAGTFGGFAITDDPIGRSYTAGFRVKM